MEMTRRGADLIVIDDPLKPEEALSAAQRRTANEWFDHTLYSRLNDKSAGAIVLIMHRLHEDDLTGHVLAQEDWELVSLPALAETDECHLIEHFCGPERVVRARGAALHEAREGAPVLARIRRTIGEYNFAGQYQQAPAPLGGGLVKPAWFARYRAGEAPQQFERIVASWDTANKPAPAKACEGRGRPSSPTSAWARSGASPAGTSISSMSCASASTTRN